jgi:hypothetical protein
MGKFMPGRSNGNGPVPVNSELVEGISAVMRPVEAVIRELAKSDVPVLPARASRRLQRAFTRFLLAERIHFSFLSVQV